MRGKGTSFELPTDPELLLEGTIEFVSATVAFATMDGGEVAKFLDSQKYDPNEASGVTYAVTFDIFGRGFARVLADVHLRALDLADLYAMPWDRYQRVGYAGFWVSRIDGADLSPAELDRLEQEVTNDLRFDYSDDELDFWFDSETSKGSLQVSVQDHVAIDT